MSTYPVDIYERLLQAFGHQDWWPGDSPFEVMVGAVLTQNTSWKNVEKAIPVVFRISLLCILSWPTVVQQKKKQSY